MLDKLIDLLKPAVSVEAKLTAISISIGKTIETIFERLSSLEQRQLQKGDKGEKGDKGLPGKDGKDGQGKDGKNGKDGLNGKDAPKVKDGKDGISVVDSWIAADGNLIIKLSNGKEIDAGSILDPIELIKSVKHIFLKQGVNVTIGEKVTNGLPGSVLFIDSLYNLAQDNPNFYWNDTNNRLGLQTNVPTGILSIGAGTATQSQINLTNGVLKTTPDHGDVEYSGGHWYITNGARHAITTSAGVKTTSTTVTNTIVETIIYSYQFAANELHTDEQITIHVSGYLSNASAADDYTINYKFNGNLLHSIARVGGNVTNQGFEITETATIRSEGVSGTAVDHLRWTEGSLTYSYGDSSIHPVNTSIPQLFEISIIWSNAKVGNILVCTQGLTSFTH